MIKFLRFTIFSIIGFIIILSIAPFFFDKSFIYNNFEKFVNEKIQQKISFDKDIGLTFFPRPSLILNNVVFDDKFAGINSKINRIKIISTWSSIINFEPKIDILEFFDPLLTFSDNKVSSNSDNQLVEYLNFLQDDVFTTPVSVKDGRYVTPKAYGWGLEMKKEFFESHIYPTGSIWKDRVESGSITFTA